MTESLSHPPVPSQDEDLRCPLCGYNLRGLEQPRCPECGHQFDWTELRDRRRTQHPFLFEHHPQRNAWSFLRTFLTTALPRRFFRKLRPTHVLNVRRLVVYWVLTMLVASFVPLAGPIASAVRSYREARAGFPAALWVRLSETRNPRAREQLFTILANQNRPPRLIEHIKAYLLPSQNLVIVSILFAWFWPWLALATLLIFRQSLRQAQIRTGHVLRCTLYSGDVAFSLAMLIFLALLMVPVVEARLPWQWRAFDPGDLAFLIALPLGIVGLTYRLWNAYRRYLAFPHALLTVVAAQIIVLLVELSLYTLWLDWSWDGR